MVKHCFLLTASHRDLDGRFEITLHAVADDGRPVVAVVDTFRPLFFVPRSVPVDRTRGCVERRRLAMRSLDGVDVDCVYFATQEAARVTAARLRLEGVRTFESDVGPVNRFLMERMVRGDFVCEGDFTEHSGRWFVRNPRIRGGRCDASLRVLSFDIETNAHTGELYSIGCAGASEVVFIRSKLESRPHLVACPDERSLLRGFIEHVTREDPDILIGWNVVDFDMRVLERRCAAAGIAFAIGRDGVARVVDSARMPGRTVARVRGRVVLDVPTMLRAFGHAFEEYSLAYVASRMLGAHKLVESTGQGKIAEINRMYAEDPVALARYNLMDARLTKKVFEAAGILPDTVERARLCGRLLDRTGGSVAAFDYLYLPRLHRAGFVALDSVDVPRFEGALSGGYVMNPHPGIYENVLVLDFRSLYPSIIMTFGIDPLGLAVRTGELVTTPSGVSFSRTRTILPGIIAQLMSARAEARRTGNRPLSQAIKLLMNSFYGVLGTPSCRFFSPELACTITETGRWLLKLTKEHIEQAAGVRVIYGDTDSLFVLLGPGRELEATDVGTALVRETNQWLREQMSNRFGAESALELQFETHFRHFLLPAVRGGAEGSKKHYCGTVEHDGDERIVFKGMESVRSDWTELAKEFQRELCLRLFHGRPTDEYIVSMIAAVRAGAHDRHLVYRRRLRKPPEEYTAGAPPHVQAARLLDEPVRRVAYSVTLDGPQPLEKQTAPIDYEHYIDAQLKPIADTLLSLIGSSFERVVSGQQELFG